MSDNDVIDVTPHKVTTSLLPSPTASPTQAARSPFARKGVLGVVAGLVVAGAMAVWFNQQSDKPNTDKGQTPTSDRIYADMKVKQTPEGEHIRDVRLMIDGKIRNKVHDSAWLSANKLTPIELNGLSLAIANNAALLAERYKDGSASVQFIRDGRNGFQAVKAGETAPSSEQLFTYTVTNKGATLNTGFSDITVKQAFAMPAQAKRAASAPAR